MEHLEISQEIREMAARATWDVQPAFDRIDRIAAENAEKVLAAFRNNRVSDSCFAGTTGYGYDDKGREVLDSIYAEVFGAQRALVRSGLVNGTHAITAALFSAVRPGDTLLSATGLPYDTLQSAIGISGNYPGSLKYYGINYGQIDLTPEGRPDYEAIASAAADKKVTAVEVQRSRGYSSRPAFTVEEIGRICEIVHRVNPNAAVIVDNCYGEFTETMEPTQVGADIMAGSLIKNPGGGIAPMGGYIAGKAELVEAASYRITSPGIGGECGATLGNNRLMFQGFFMAPVVVASALKGAIFAANIYERLNFPVIPDGAEERHDIIQAVQLGTPEGVVAFCQGIQAAAPVDSYVTPVPWDMPGYDIPVIMAAGAFVQGSSIELSADGPMKEPYAVYFQGGLTWPHAKLGILKSLQAMEDAGLVVL